MRGLKNLVQFAILLTFANVTFAGTPRTEGPTTAKVGDLVRVKITEVSDLNDPKFECYPQNENWEAVKRFNGENVILFFTKEEGEFTFVLTGNKDNKTILVVHKVIVGKPGPRPPPPTPPGPSPDPVVPAGKYTETLKAAYMVNPDNASLVLLISLYEKISQRTSSLNNYKQLQDALEATARDILGSETKLRGVRDAVSQILQQDLANRGSAQYDASKATAIFQEIARSLKPLLEK